MGHAEHLEWLARQITVGAPFRELRLADGSALPQDWAAFVAPDERPVWLGRTESDPGIPMLRFVVALGLGLGGVLLLWQGAAGVWPYLLLSGLADASYAGWRFIQALQDYHRAPHQSYLVTNRAVHAADWGTTTLNVTASLRLTGGTQVGQNGRALHLSNPDQPSNPLILHSLARPRDVRFMIQDILKAKA